MSTPKATAKAEEAARLLRQLLTEYAAKSYYGVVTFEFSFQAGVIQQARHGTEKVLPIKTTD